LSFSLDNWEFDSSRPHRFEYILMGQAEIQKVLKETNKWMTCRQIAKDLCQNQGVVSRGMRRMAKAGDVFYKEIESENFGRRRVKAWKIK